MQNENNQHLPLLVITGVSGFIGSQTCLTFLKSGKFRVRGTVRSTKNEKKIEPLRAAFGEYFEQLELVEADLNNEQSIIDACAGATYLVHTASPFVLEKPKHEDELIKPAVNGCLAAMKGAHIHKLKRVVVTSSIMSIMASKEFKTYISRDDWSDTTSSYGPSPAYMKSKTLAEQACWDFVKKLPEEEKFELTTICPSLVVGPTLVSNQFASADFIKAMLTQVPAIPDVTMHLVDVRDVAKAHLNAILIEEAKNQRFVLSQDNFSFVDIFAFLREGSGHEYPKLPKRNIPYFLVWVAALFSADARLAKAGWGKTVVLENKETKDVLQVPMDRPMKDNLREMVLSLQQYGFLEKPAVSSH